jgi:hypothetical protein
MRIAILGAAAAIGLSLTWMPSVSAAPANPIAINSVAGKTVEQVRWYHWWHHRHCWWHHGRRVCD